MLKTSLMAGAIVLSGAGAAHAADIIDTAPVSDWSGFYAGVHGGYGWGDFDYNARIRAVLEGDLAPLGPDHVDFGDGGDSDGFFAGVQAGFNWQMDSVLLGVEGDISKSWIGSDDGRNLYVADYGFLGSDANARTETDLDWFGTLRLRAGFLATPDLLIYGTGGLAWGNVDTDVRVRFDDPLVADYSYNDSSTSMGWTLGGGLEYAVTEAVSIKAEYLYVDLGSEDIANGRINGNDIRVDQDLTFHTVRAGLNFHF